MNTSSHVTNIIVIGLDRTVQEVHLIDEKVTENARAIANHLGSQYMEDGHNLINAFMDAIALNQNSKCFFLNPSKVTLHGIQLTKLD